VEEDNMKRLGFLGLGVLVLAVVSMACSVPALVIGERETVRGNGEVVETTREVEDYSRLTFAGQGNLYIEQGFEEALVFEVEENLIEHLEIEVRGDTLVIGTKEGKNLRPTEPMNFYLSVIDLDRVTLAGSGLIEAEEFQAENLSLTLSGSGNVVIEYLEAVSLNVDLTGSGNIELTGDIKDQDLTISGSGDYDARGLESSVADIVISGSGTAEISVEDNLDVFITGSGNVRYYGSPSIDETITGSGSVDKLGE
jgi:hypothetical protein